MALAVLLLGWLCTGLVRVGPEEVAIHERLGHPLSRDAVGGDNLISRDCRSIDKIIQLQRPLEALVVDKSVFDAVTPLGSPPASYSFRDVLLVTFQASMPHRVAS